MAAVSNLVFSKSLGIAAPVVPSQIAVQLLSPGASRLNFSPLVKWAGNERDCDLIATNLKLFFFFKVR